jgi:flagellar hook-associated protein 1 FlgK
MPSLASGIHTALTAMLAQSQAVEIIEHNVANVSTKGYHRQSAVMSATSATVSSMQYQSYSAGMMGMGVNVDRINRFSLEFFDSRYRAVAADSKSWEYQNEIFVQMETILSDLSDEGLSTQMDQFFLDWQNVAADPTDSSLRTELLSNAATMCDKFNSNAQQLLALRVDQNLAVRNRVQEVNTLAQSVASLNAEISRVLSVGEQPNDLMDQRDLALDRLAELVGATSTVQENGEAIVSVGGHVLVTGHEALKLTTVADTDPANAGVDRVVWEANSADVNLSGGELEGILRVRDYYIPNYLSNLNSVAQNIITQVNTLHVTGFTLNGQAGEAFFTGDSALNIQVNQDLNPEDIAASSIAGELGNSLIASSICDLRDAKLMGGGAQTLSEFYNVMMTDLASSTLQAENNYKQYSTVLEALSDQRQSVTGVSLDEEAANLVIAQKAYQAAARVMTAYDELLDIVINSMGLVGR